MFSGFSGSSAGEESICNAGDVGSIPGWGTKSPRVMGQLSLCVTTTGPMYSGVSAPTENREETCVLQQKIPNAETKTQCNQK